MFTSVPSPSGYARSIPVFLTYPVSVEIIESSWNDFSTKSPALLCLGLGSPSSSGIARVQLAFLTETCNRLNVAQDAVSVYDPVFTAEDKVLFEELQMRVLSKNNARFFHSSSADYALAAPTICFMPHCDIELYEAVLRSNWSLEGLSKLFILGNQLQEYIDNKPTSALESTVPCLLRAAPRLESQPLPISSTWPTAFNNTSAQYHQCGAGQADKSENPIEKERQGVGNSDLAAAI
ncbi:hypothetical protein BDZ97DRAFT_1902982 [Flammula alnicola]|nr:hypothetical protein BDZ97DRAFT_1902982 [Flammula alnicola]